MNWKRYYKTAIFLLFTPVFVFSQKPEWISGTDKCLSFINISGNTNINAFEFNMNFSGDEEFIIGNDDKIVKTGAEGKNTKFYEIKVPVKNFESENKLIYKDFLDLLKADEYPYVTIGIPYNQLKEIMAGNTGITPDIRITIAGVTKTYSFPGIVQSCTEGARFINGIKSINLTDFNLDPPEKFKGLIKVKDQVVIHFGFVFLLQHNV